MPTLLDRYEQLKLEDLMIDAFFGSSNALSRTITNTETRLEIEAGMNLLVIRPWGWTWYLYQDRLGDHHQVFKNGDFPE